MLTAEDILLVKDPDVMVATRQMAEAGVGSVVIEDDDRADGIFTERDLLQRVVVAGRDPSVTTLSDVMSSPATTAFPELTAGRLPQ